MNFDLAERLTFYIPLLLSLTVHEWAHAWTAWKLGDDTARMMGRVSLNPLDHIDPIGTVLLPLIGIPFGWAKPVPINPVRFRREVSMTMGILVTAAAGPISNLMLAAASVLMIILFGQLDGILAAKSQAAIQQVLQFAVIINVLLALFNMIPIPPLDGSRIVDGLVTGKARTAWDKFCQFGPIMLVAVFLLPMFKINLFEPPIRWVTTLIECLT